MDFGGSQLLPARPHDRRVKKPKDKPQAGLGCWPPHSPPLGSLSLWVAVPRVRAGTVIWGGSRERSLPHTTELRVGQKQGKRGL